MSEFLDACRREWRRLGVPDPIAGEMAADLAADLEQAETEGVAAEEVLGSGAFDPAGFAAAWAAERGVIPASPPPRSSGRRWPALAAIACFAIVTLVGAALAVFAFHGATVVGVVHTASAGVPRPPLHGFTRHVGPPAPGLRPFALTLLVVGLLGIAGTTFLSLRLPRRRLATGQGERRPA
ncbi:MAG: hypothetical protein QM729_05850 [Solirubrobacterales bacterium]